MGEVIKGTVCVDRYTMDYFYFGKGEKPLVIIPGLAIKSVMKSASALSAPCWPWSCRASY